MAEQQARTRMTKDWLAGVEQEEAELQTKVKRLETHVNSSAPCSVEELQVLDKRFECIMGTIERLPFLLLLLLHKFVSLPAFRGEPTNTVTS